MLIELARGITNGTRMLAIGEIGPMPVVLTPIQRRVCELSVPPGSVADGRSVEEKTETCRTGQLKPLSQRPHRRDAPLLKRHCRLL
jgi:hypothetical protein